MHNAANGVIRRTGAEGYELVFVRRLKKPIEKVWAAVTVPERIADWFADMRFTPEPRLGAGVELRFPDDTPPFEMTGGEVVAFDPPRLFAWSWPDGDRPASIIRFELEPDGDGCVLTFSQASSTTGDFIGVGAGWQVFLDGLEGAADGVRTRQDLTREMALRPAYAAQLATLRINESHGVIRKTGETYEIVFVRRFAKPPEKVWAALTAPERLADWLANATIEPRLEIGARFALHFPASDYRMSGRIVAFEPPCVIAWTWPDPAHPGFVKPGVVRFELTPDGDGCVLTLTNTCVARANLENVAAGWHTHLEALPGAAEGFHTPWSGAHEAVHEARYKAALSAPA